MSGGAWMIAGSGKVLVSINGKAVATISANGHSISISVDDGAIRATIRRFGLTNAIKLLGKASEALYKMGAAVEVRSSRGTLIQLGVGAYSTTTKFKANLVKLLLLMLD